MPNEKFPMTNEAGPAAVAIRWSTEITAQRSPWAPFRQGLETRVAAVRSALRRQQRRVGTVIDERLHRDP